MLRKDDKGRRMSRKFRNVRHKPNKVERIAEEKRVAAISANRKIRHETTAILKGVTPLSVTPLSLERLEEVMV